MNRSGQRFFAINVFSRFHRRDRNDGMQMIRCPDDYCINPFFLLQHYSVIFVLLGLGIFIESPRGISRIYVTESNDVFTAHLLNIRSPLSPDANPGNIQFFIGRSVTFPAQYCRLYDEETGDGGGDMCWTGQDQFVLARGHGADAR